MKKVVLALSILICSCSNKTPLEKLKAAYPTMYACRMGDGYYELYDKDHKFVSIVNFNLFGYPQTTLPEIALFKKSLNDIPISARDYCMVPSNK